MLWMYSVHICHSLTFLSNTVDHRILTDFINIYFISFYLVECCWANKPASQPASQPPRWDKSVCRYRDSIFESFLNIFIHKTYSMLKVLLRIIIAYPRKRCVKHVPINLEDTVLYVCKHCSIVNRHAKMPFGLSNSLSMKCYFVNSFGSFIWMCTHFWNGAFGYYYYYYIFRFNLI